MRITIAIIAVLVVGSNAGLLGGILGPVLSPVTHLLDGLTASNRANGCRDSLQSQIKLLQDSACISIKGQLQILSDRIVVFQQGTLLIANGLVIKGAIGAVGLVADLRIVIDGVLVLVQNLLSNLLGVLGLVVVAPEKNDLVSLIIRICVNLNIQIGSTCKPSIDLLNLNVGSGKIKLQCFLNEIPEIEGNITAVVHEVSVALDNEICRVIQLVADILDLIDHRLLGLQSGCQACNADLDCQVKLVRAVSDSLHNDVIGWLLCFTGDATNDVAELLFDVNAIVNDVGIRLRAITKDVAACV